MGRETDEDVFDVFLHVSLELLAEKSIFRKLDVAGVA